MNFGYYLLQITYLDNKQLFKAVLFEECCACQEQEACFCQKMKTRGPLCYAENPHPCIIPSSLSIPINTSFQTNTVEVPSKAVGPECLQNSFLPIFHSENASSGTDSFQSCSPSSPTFGISELFSAQSVEAPLENHPLHPLDTNKSSTTSSTLNSASYTFGHLDPILDESFPDSVFLLSSLFADTSSHSPVSSRSSSRPSSPSNVSSRSSSVSNYLPPHFFSNSPQLSHSSSVLELDNLSICSFDHLFADSPHLLEEIEDEHQHSDVSSSSLLSVTRSVSSSHSLSSSSSRSASSESVSISDSLANSWSSAGSW